MDIVSLPIEYDKDKIDSRFRLVTIAAQRARELAFGAKPKIETKFGKIPTVALIEALEGELEFLTGDEASIAQKEAKKFDYKRFLEEKKKDAMSTDLTELEKDLRTYLTERDEFDKSAIEDLFGEKNEGQEEKAK
jgi:DNA-directed RNA polymerase subunit omega